jgi:inosine/xanthosine triphosphatase
VAVGSTNPGKIAAVQAAVDRLWPGATVQGVDVPSGVPDQPRGEAAGAYGALMRAAAARHALDADLGVGLEGCADEQPWGTWTLAWAAVVDRQEQVGLASSARCPLPAAVAADIRAGGELGPLVDQLVNETHTKHRGGANGVFTAGHLGRIPVLADAVICACAPWLTPQFFGPGAQGRLPDLLAALETAAGPALGSRSYAKSPI